jgi:uncharacterized membrane protein YfcA
MITALALIVAITAALFGMMGLGGGLVYVPLLSWWGLDFTTGAIPMSLLLSTATGMAAAYTYTREGLVHVRTAMAAIITVFIGAPVGAWAVHRLPVGYVKILFAAAAGYVAMRILISKEPGAPKERDTRAVMLGALVIGTFVGFSSGLLGIGGGFLLIPFLLASGIPTREAVATSSLVITVSALTAFISHLGTSTFPISTALLLAGAAVVGSRLGGLWAARQARPTTLRKIAGSLILLIAVKVAVEGVRLLPG